VVPNRAGYGGHKLNDRLMRQAHRVFDAPKNPRCYLLFLRKAAIEPVHQNARVNESGHARRVPPLTNLHRQRAVPHAPPHACDAVRLPGRTRGVARLDLAARSVCREGTRIASLAATSSISSPGRLRLAIRLWRPYSLLRLALPSPPKSPACAPPYNTRRRDSPGSWHALHPPYAKFHANLCGRR